MVQLPMMDDNCEPELPTACRLISLKRRDLDDIERAIHLLENTSLVSRISTLVSWPVSSILDLLPTAVKSRLSTAVSESLGKAMNLVVSTMGGAQGPRFRWPHKTLATFAGAAGGALGVPALAVELPFTTCLMLRSIAGIARSEGEDLTDPSTRIACMEVFAFGGPSSAVDYSGLGYFALRQSLARESEKLVQYLLAGPVGDEATPVIVRFLEVIASRFGVVVGEKTAAQFLPVVGALGGATINLLFMKHFQDLATGHFTIRRLERRFGQDLVKEHYQRITQGALLQIP